METNWISTHKALGSYAFLQLKPFSPLRIIELLLVYTDWEGWFLICSTPQSLRKLGKNMIQAAWSLSIQLVSMVLMLVKLIINYYFVRAFCSILWAKLWKKRIGQDREKKWIHYYSTGSSTGLLITQNDAGDKKCSNRAIKLMLMPMCSFLILCKRNSCFFL